MSMCTILMTDKPLPTEIPVSISFYGKKETVIFGKNGVWDYSYYEEGCGIDDYVCIDDLKPYVPTHWYGGIYLRDPRVDSVKEAEFQYNFIRELIKIGTEVWYVKTWYGDVIKKEDMVIKDIDLTNIHYIDKEIKSELSNYEPNVFYRFVMK